MNRQRLVDRIPRIYVGPDAERALAGEPGLLLGAQRPRWIDVLEFEPRHRTRWKALAELRFASFAPWDVVGLSLASAEFVQWKDDLLRELVPGDVLITEEGASVHRGDIWGEAQFVRG